ncbi:MAG: diguanylate cyclase [Planctomycetota bacterium]|nr:MAG: diguanylate cyclase [Planctomycetota bacterium]
MEILIAEDDRISRHTLKRILEKWGHRVTAAENGQQAWDFFLTHRPPMVITDWEMPEISGLDLCSRIKDEVGNSGDTYLILLTANDKPKHLAEGLFAGADDYVKKPFNQQELQARIRSGERIIQMAAALRKAKEEMERQALTDSLTSLPNRRAMLETLRSEESRMLRERRPVGVVMVDVDNFKNINDTFGHQTGDKVLKLVADCLAGTIRGGDHVGRWGGEEFLTILPGADLIQCAEIAERCRAFLANQRVRSEDGQVFHVTASFGAAATQGAGRLDIMTLVQHADKAMYWSKAAGRNRVKIFVERRQGSSKNSSRQSS